MNRVARATRLHLVGWPTMVAAPWAVLASAFVVNLAIFWTLHDRGVPANFTGGLASIYVTVLLVFVQAMGRQLLFALGFSLTRRSYYLATVTFIVGQALAFAVVLYLLRLIERATDGWGVDLSFYAVQDTSVGNPVGQILAYAGPFVLLATIGTLIGAVHLRWKATGLYLSAILAILLGGLATLLITYWRGWDHIGSWFGGQSTLALCAGWPVLLALMFAGGTYLIIRRATP
jgi:hypothetical protein